MWNSWSYRLADCHSLSAVWSETHSLQIDHKHNKYKFEGGQLQLFSLWISTKAVWCQGLSQH